MFRGGIKAKILRNTPVSVDKYSGHVFDQSVSIELQGDTIIDLFDPDLRSKDDMVGTIKTVGILAFAAHVAKLPSPVKRVESEPPFFGEIVYIDAQYKSLYVDVGPGTIVVGLCHEERDTFPDYRVGDYVRVGPSRLDFVGAWDLDGGGGSGWAHIVANYVDTPASDQFYSAFGLYHVHREKIKDLIMTGARDGVASGKNIYRYREPVSGRVLHLLVADSGYLVTAYPETPRIPDGSLRESLKVPVRVVAIRPDAEYEGKMYTQVVRVEFTNGTRISVLDDDLLCTPGMIGQTRNVVLSMLGRLERQNVTDQEVYAEPAMPLIEINGRVDALIDPDDPAEAEWGYMAVVDFGFGKVLVETNSEYFLKLKLQEGDRVRIDGRVDLRGIE
jgi:hypothetical protein